MTLRTIRHGVIFEILSLHLARDDDYTYYRYLDLDNDKLPLNFFRDLPRGAPFFLATPINGVMRHYTQIPLALMNNHDKSIVTTPTFRRFIHFETVTHREVFRFDPVSVLDIAFARKSQTVQILDDFLEKSLTLPNHLIHFDRDTTNGWIEELRGTI